jgi:hypothetical protein
VPWYSDQPPLVNWEEIVELKSIDLGHRQVEISGSSGAPNGWTTFDRVYGICTRVGESPVPRRSLWMDINGARVLKKRLSLNGTGHAAPAPADVDVPEDAPRVYHWLGVAREAEDHEPSTAAASLFSRSGLSFR